MSVSAELSRIEATAKPVVVVTSAQQKTLASLVSVAPALVVVTSNEEYASAGSSLVQIKTSIKQIDALHDEISKPLDDAMLGIKSSITKLKAFFNVPKQKLLTAEGEIKTAMNAYLQAEEAKRAAAQKLLDDAAAKERARVKALADAAAKKAAEDAAAARQRQADIQAAAAKAAADATRKQNELIAKGKVAAAAAAKEKSDLQAKLAAAEAATEAAKAEKIEVQASVRADIATAKIVSLEAPTVQYEAPKAAGVTSRKNWVHEVYDEKIVPREYLCLDDKKIKAAIAAGERAIPGLMIKQASSIVGTGK